MFCETGQEIIRSLLVIIFKVLCVPPKGQWNTFSNTVRNVPDLWQCCCEHASQIYIIVLQATGDLQSRMIARLLCPAALKTPTFFFSTLCNFSHWVLGVQRPFIDASHWEHTCTPFQIFWKTGKQWLATCRAHLVITFLCSWTLGCLKGYHKHTLERRKRKEGATGQGIVFGAAPAERNHWA